jgi:hypothetical protein
MFLTLMVVGLAGLVAMALPALARHGGAGHAHAALHAGHVGKLAAPGHASTALVAAKATSLARPSGVTRFLPSPRLVFSVAALYGAFGNVLLAAHFALGWAALAAIVPAALVERFAVTPLWRLVFRYQGQPSGPLADLVMSEATAVTGFRRGRGIVSLVREGRAVQFSARLIDTQIGVPVKVGDRLRVEDIDPERERLTVSILVA